jgi:glycosyltransferase involved in cell wall biosynthesis
MPRRKFVFFLHVSRNVHWVDAAVTRLASALADEIWADSKQTLIHRLPSHLARKGRVISFLVRRQAPLPAAQARPAFIFWGRVTAQKQLERALRIFAAVRRSEPGACFQVIGPDGGELERMRKLSIELGIDCAVSFAGARDFQAIVGLAAGSSFYLQTSSFEGMAVSVVEAMQLGLVPIVTPVGEIERYCTDGFNALVVQNDAQAVDAILALLRNNDEYQRMRDSAIATWSATGLYRDSVLSACRAMLGSKSSTDVAGTIR